MASPDADYDPRTALPTGPAPDVKTGPDDTYDPRTSLVTSAPPPAADKTTDTPPSTKGWISRSWASVEDAATHLASGIKRDLTPSWNIPGTAPADNVFDRPENRVQGVDATQPVNSELMWGVARGLKDVTDTGHRIFTDLTGGDMAALRKQQKDSED